MDDLDLAEIHSAVADAIRIGQLYDPGVKAPRDLSRWLGLIRSGC